MKELQPHSTTHITAEDLQQQFAENRARLEFLRERGSYDTREEEARLQDTISELGDRILNAYQAQTITEALSEQYSSQEAA